MNNLHLVPMIIGHRMVNLAMLAVDPSPRRFEEALRMGTEKSDALVFGLLAAQMAAIQGGMSFWVDVMSGRPVMKGLNRTMKRMHSAGSAPANRTLRANAKRLSRKKA